MARSLVGQIFDECAKEHLPKLLANEGFEAQGEWFIRWHGDCCHRIVTDVRVDRSEPYGIVDVFAGAGFRSIAKVLARTGLFKGLELVHRRRPCVVTKSLFQLLPPIDDSTISIEPDDHPYDIAARIYDRIKEVCIPFLNTITSINTLVAHIHSERKKDEIAGHTLVCLAVCYFFQGEREQALNLVREREEMLSNDFVKSGRSLALDSLYQMRTFRCWLESQEGAIL